MHLRTFFYVPQRESLIIFAWMGHEAYQLKVSGIVRETEDAVSVCFDVPEELQQAFSFLPGQHITLVHAINGVELRRSYSICAAPYEGLLKIASRRVPNGAFSTFLNEHLQVGDRLLAEPPEGRFWIEIQPSSARQFVFFAAGSGITPILSNVKQLLYEEANCQVQLFYGNRTTASILFLEELMELKNKYPDRLSLHFILSKEQLEEEIYNGRLDEDKLILFADHFFNPAEVDAFFLCGPEAMILSLRQALLNLGVSPKNVHVELFGVQLPQAKPAELKVSEGVSNIGIRLDGRRFEFRLPYHKESILDAALGQGAGLPFACKGGVCCTCKARLLSGEVQMVRNFGLEPDELKNGYVLTCQSYPITPNVELSFDN